MEEKTKTKEIKRIIYKNLRWVLLCLCTIFLLKLIDSIFENEIHFLDDFIYRIISSSISDPMTFLMKIFTVAGSALVLITICLAAILGFKEKRYGFFMTLNLFVIAASNQILKNVFNRPRPVGFRLIEETGYSFPSGHSMVSMAFYGLLIYFCYKKVKNKYLKWALCIALGCLILAIGVSRIYLGVHYASDVVGGFCFSIAYLCVYTSFLAPKINKM